MKKTIQIKVVAVVEVESDVPSLADALIVGADLTWDEILPGITIVDGKFSVVGVYEYCDL